MWRVPSGPVMGEYGVGIAPDADIYAYRVLGPYTEAAIPAGYWVVLIVPFKTEWI